MTNNNPHKQDFRVKEKMNSFSPPSSQIQSITLITKPRGLLNHVLSLILPSARSTSGLSGSGASSSSFGFGFGLDNFPILLPFVSLFVLIISHYLYMANKFINASVEVKKQMGYDVVFGIFPLSYFHAIFFVLTFIALVIILLAAYWNVSLRVRLFYTPIQKNTRASLLEIIEELEKKSRDIFLHIIPEKHQGIEEIVPLSSKIVESYRSKPLASLNSRTSTTSSKEIFFSYQKRKFKYNPETNEFEKPKFRNKEKISYYLNYKGLESMNEITKCIEDYGMNRLDIPVPTFWELFKEHALAPFFVFQVACMGLWCLDEYWYYSLFTLFMLFIFESTVVKQRQRNLNQVREMSSKPFRLYVYRRHRWTEMSSDMLVPGDLISIKKFESATGQEIVTPCDVLLRAGKCVTNEALLTGESTPQLKESIEEHDDPEQNLNVKKGSDKRHVVFGGTTILQHNHHPDQTTMNSNPELCPPDGGCVGVVMKTGFETSQGKLVRLILFTAEHVTGADIEALHFILFLLVFAFAASAYVLYRGLQDSTRSKYKLLLNCIMIITSVVPPELPMELSMAVNNSLIALQKFHIFCTQPFRIPYGGRVTVCCFDKTGTLTNDKMSLKYVTNPESHEKNEPAIAATEAKYVLSSCHSLINMEGHIVGDPMETAGVEGVSATYENDKVVVNGNTFVIHRRFAFASELKRMSCVVEDLTSHKYYVFCKGAPETIKIMLRSVPANYDNEVTQFSAEGARVIALAWKEYIPGSGINMLDHTTHKHIQRQDVECDFHFAGFAGFDSGIKPYTINTMNELVQSNHKVIMITGDNPLTACHVGVELLFATKPVLISRVNEGKLEWHSETLDKSADFDKFDDNFDYCVTGDILEKKENDSVWLNKWIPRVAIFARTTPIQKELILTVLKNLGYGTLMCGDGTNDVGALKQADVGVALLENRKKDKPKTTEATPNSSAPPPAPTGPPRSFSEFWQQLKEKAHAAQAAQAAKSGNLNKTLKSAMEDENSVVQLGDASIAAPFSSKLSNIVSVYHIIRQGRCTLATTMQMYKILALNCLISAYSLSVLYLDGIKYGDSQMIISGIAVAMAFLFVSRSQPLARLSKERPQNSIFNFYFMFSLLGQFFIHILILILCSQAAKVAQPPDEHDKAVDTKFKPNLVNSVVFIVTSLQTVVTFVVNYIGHPFMQSLWENRGLFICLVFLGSVCLAAASNLIPELNEGLELVMMPSEIFRNFFVMMLIADIVVCIAWEKLCKKLLGSSD